VVPGGEHGIEEDAAEGNLGAALVAEGVVDGDPDHAAGDQMSQDQGNQDQAEVVPLPDGGAKDRVRGVVMALGGPAGGLPDSADGMRSEADDPAGQQGLEGLEDLGMETLVEGLYQSGERGNKLIHGADLRAVSDPGVPQQPPGYSTGT
jgi:hypothetical protein